MYVVHVRVYLVIHDVTLILQCVEYFQEWSLNPPNYSYDEIRKGNTSDSLARTEHGIYSVYRASCSLTCTLAHL